MVWTKETILQALTEQRETLQSMGVIRIGLFGSYVRGEQTPESDIDLLLEGTDRAMNTFRGYFDLLHYLEDFFERKVDLVLADGIKPLVRPYIMSEVVYAEGYANPVV